LLFLVSHLRPATEVSSAIRQWEVPIGDGFDELEFKDLDRDGVQEFTQRDNTFNYWADLAYVSSPQPEVVFQYHPRLKRFLPASKKFSAYLLKDIAKDIQDLDRSDPHQHWVRSLDITLRYIFAGKEERGWKFYDKQFGIRPGGRDRMKTKIKKALKSDALYRSMYGRWYLRFDIAILVFEVLE
jgi:hypothetical protein